ESQPTLAGVLDGVAGRYEPVQGHTLRTGRATGRLTGGKLALLAAACGTPWQPNLAGAIVFIEDIGERPYRLDRALVQCEQAGLIDGVARLAYGYFTHCDEPGGQ